MRYPPITGCGTARLTPDLQSLRRDYRHQPDAEPEPREIVARLHAEIAAKSPEHAAMVAGWEQRNWGTPAGEPQR